MKMMCRTRVEDFDRWFGVFQSHKNAHKEAGLVLELLARENEDPDNIFFVFEVQSLDRAIAFIESPESAEAGKSAGVIDGEYHFVDELNGY